jgi:hypothetical protein
MIGNLLPEVVSISETEVWLDSRRVNDHSEVYQTDGTRDAAAVSTIGSIQQQQHNLLYQSILSANTSHSYRRTKNRILMN